MADAKYGMIFPRLSYEFQTVKLYSENELFHWLLNNNRTNNNYIFKQFTSTIVHDG